MDAVACPRCASPRTAGPECPRCGVIYAKAHAPAGLPATWDGDADDARLELRLRTWAIPAALLVARLLVATGVGHFLVRVFLSMWVHETGHALAAWLCGFPAFPGPWLTPMAAQRSAVFATVIAFALAFALVRCWKADRRGLAACAGVMLVAQGAGTIALSADAARALVVFAGDGGCLLIGALLMASVYAPEGSAVQRGWLRWGFLAIGSASFMDAFEQWWAARTDPDRIPFGRNEGAGLSDPSVLSDVYGWSATAIVQRYLALGCVCLAVLAVLYVVNLARARAAYAAR